MLLSGIGRRKVNILWAIKHPTIGCLLYIIFQLIDKSQCSSNPDGNSYPAKVENTKPHLTERVAQKSKAHGCDSLDWFRDSMERNRTIYGSNENLLRSINFKVDEINENLKTFIRILKPDNKNERNVSKIIENSSAKIEFTVNNNSISNFVKNFSKEEITEIDIPESSVGFPGNVPLNKEDHLDQTTYEALTDLTEEIPGGVSSNSREGREYQPEQITTEKLEGLNNVSNETPASIEKPHNDTGTNESSDNIDANSTENYDYPTAPRNDESNKSEPPIPSTMAGVPDLGGRQYDQDYADENMQQLVNLNESLSVSSQHGNSTQQEPLESYRTSEESSSTPTYQSESNPTLIPNDIPKSIRESIPKDTSKSISESTTNDIPKSISESTTNDIPKIMLESTPNNKPKSSPESASFTANKNMSSNQVGNLDPGYPLKRVVLQGVDKIHFSLDEHVIKLPQDKADIYLFYYIPETMNLSRSGDHLYLPNEHHKHYEGGYLKHRYTSARNSDDYSAYSLHHHKLMHSYAKAKQPSKPATTASTAALRTFEQPSNASAVNHITVANHKTEKEDSDYYFVAPYFGNNHTFGSFQLIRPSPPASPAHLRTIRAAKAISEEPRDLKIGKNEQLERKTTYDYVDFYASDPTDEIKCSGDMKWCVDKSKCIQKTRWCNRIIDCPDKSDELHCTCLERMDGLKICDHYVDCPNGEDEKGCFGCPEDAFSCDHSMLRPNGTCMSMNQRCDGRYDCNDLSDELNCELLTDTVDSHETFLTSYSSGYLHRNFRGRWYPACIDIRSERVWGLQACKAELLVDVRHVEAELLPFHGDYAGKFITHEETGHIAFVDICIYPGYAIHVKCPSMPCGNRVIQRNTPSSDYRSKRLAPSDSEIEPIYQALELLVGKSYVESIRKERSSRVVRGIVSKQGEWPWLVALNRDGEFHCGGTIIDDTWILTAGHCVYGYRDHFFEVYAGMLRRFSYSPSEQLRTVTHVIIHPEYSHDLKNDLALLKLNEPLKFNRWVRPACLPVDRPPWGPLAGTQCTAAGWGSVWENQQDYPDNLREVRLPIKSRCKDKADQEGEEICAGYEDGGMDTCQGDSGGPLLCNLPRAYDQSYIAGIVSHGAGCARPHQPGAYTRVALFIPWIITHTDNKFLTPARESSHECPNLRCLYEGRCIAAKRICDRIVDCLSAEDEIDCRLSMLNSEEDDSGLVINEHYKLNKSLDEIRILNRLTKSNSTVLPSSKQTRNDSNQSPNIHFQSLPLVQEPFSGVFKPNTSSNLESSVNGEVFVEKRETASYFTCKNLHQNIPLEFYCDTEVDCEDGTDEINCSCADYLKVTNESLICDGIIHCYDLSDEKYCQDYNCTSDEFFCYKSRLCIPRELVCDGKNHCFHGEDENRCYWPIPIATATTIENQFDLFGVPLFSDQGVLAYNDHAVWKWMCFPDEKTMEVPKTVQKLAKRLGFKNYASYSHLMVLDDEVLNRRQQNYCSGLSVNFGVAHVEDESLIPWRVSIFVNGISKCLGVLIGEEWVLTDHSCCSKLNTSTDYLVAVFGRDEKLSGTIRTYEEQTKLVDRIRCDRKTNTALMHLSKRIQTTKKTKSLGVISTQKILELKKNFLLILQDTQSNIFELMVTSNCSVASFCYKMKYDVDFCLNSNSSLKFASVISLSKKQEWTFSGIVVESLTCLTNETVVTINRPQTLSRKETEFVNISEFYYRGHRGYRCTLGNEISWENVCDKKGDCREKEDEIDSACQEKKLLIEGGFIIPSCKVDEFECKNGHCVSKSAICNSTNDCGDNSDEPETCSHFTCAAYLNLTNPQKLCDSRQDCEDKSDENISTCPSLCEFPSSFRCNKSNSCIPLDFVCDGERDCESGEDEEECISYRETDHNRTEGAIWTRSNGKWKQHCFTPSEMVAFDAQNLCKLLGYSQATNNRTIPATNHNYSQSSRVKLNHFLEVTLKRNAEKQIDSTEYCEHLYLTCR